MTGHRIGSSWITHQNGPFAIGMLQIHYFYVLSIFVRKPHSNHDFVIGNISLRFFVSWKTTLSKIDANGDDDNDAGDEVVHFDVEEETNEYV